MMQHQMKNLGDLWEEEGRRKSPENWKLTEEIHKYVVTMKQ